MGKPIPGEPPEPPEPGLPCVDCDKDHGGPFIIGETPKFLHAKFYRMVKCPCNVSGPEPPNGKIWTLEQNHSVLCRWDYSDDDWVIIYRAFVQATPPYSVLTLLHRIYTYYFFAGAIHPPKCSLTFNNENDCTGAGTGAYGGRGIIFSIEASHMAYALASTYGFSPPRCVSPTSERKTDPGKYEPDIKPWQDERTFCLAHWFDKTNILIKFRPYELKY